MVFAMSFNAPGFPRYGNARTDVAYLVLVTDSGAIAPQGDRLVGPTYYYEPPAFLIYELSSGNVTSYGPWFPLVQQNVVIAVPDYGPNVQVNLLIVPQQGATVVGNLVNIP